MMNGKRIKAIRIMARDKKNYNELGAPILRQPKNHKQVIRNEVNYRTIKNLKKDLAKNS